MKRTQALHTLGQSLWLDNITRDMLDDGSLRRYVDEYAVTGLTSNPSIFDAAIEKGTSYDADIRRMAAQGLAAEPLFLELALADLRRAADLFAPVHARTGGVDGWVSMEVSPLLADAAAGRLDGKRVLFWHTYSGVDLGPLIATGPGPSALPERLRHHFGDG
jgi:transaldolase